MGHKCFGTSWDTNGTGLDEAGSIPTVWTEKDYNWRVPIPGEGHSQPVIWGEKIFLTSALDEGQKRVAICLSTSNGKILWSKTREMSTHSKHRLNSFASSTPTVDAKRVYIVFGSPESLVITARSHDGKQEWLRHLGSFKTGHGYGPSPVLFENLVVLANDQDEDSFVIGLDRQTGATVWKTP